MKKLTSLIVIFASLLFVNVIAQGEEFMLWDSVTFTPTAPDTVYLNGDVIAISDEINNNNNLNSVTIVLQYKNTVPFSGTFRIGAIIEGNIMNEWHPIGYQYKVVLAAPLVKYYVTHILPFAKQEEGEGFSFSIGNEQLAFKSINVGAVPDKFRVKLLVGDFSNNVPLESLTITGYGRKYNIK